MLHRPYFICATWYAMFSFGYMVLGIIHYASCVTIFISLRTIRRISSFINRMYTHHHCDQLISTELF